MAEELKAILDDEAKLLQVTSDVFDQVDTDGSGQVSKTELKAALKTFAEAAGLPLPSEEEVTKVLQALDADASGSLDKAEFQVLVRAALEALVSA